MASFCAVIDGGRLAKSSPFLRQAEGLKKRIKEREYANQVNDSDRCGS